MPVSRLFLEIGQQVDRLDQSLRDMVNTAQDAGVKVTGAGQSILAKFNDALNPTVQLGQQLELLQKAGASQADVWKVYGDRLTEASEKATRFGQVLDPTVQNMLDFGKATETSGFSIEGLGRTLTDFAQNPLQAVKSGIGGFLESLGPTAVAIGGIGVAAALAGKEFFDLAQRGADEAQQLVNLSAKTGLTTQQLQALQQIGKEAGLENLDLGRTIGMLNQQLATGEESSGAFAKALRSFGISIEDGNGHTKDAITLLDQLKTYLQGITDPTERAQKAQEALGGRLRDLIPLILDSTKSLSEQIATMEATGPVWDNITTVRLVALHKGFAQVTTVWDTLVANIEAGAGAIIDGFTGIADAAERELVAKTVKAIKDAEAELAKYGITVDKSGKSWNEYTDSLALAQNEFKNMQGAMQAMGESFRVYNTFTVASIESMDAFKARIAAILAGHKDLADLYAKEADLQKQLKEAEDSNDRDRALVIANQVAGIKETIKAKEEQEAAWKKINNELIESENGLLDLWSKELKRSIADYNTSMTLLKPPQIQGVDEELLNSLFPSPDQIKLYTDNEMQAWIDGMSEKGLKGEKVWAEIQADISKESQKTQNSIQQSIAHTFDQTERALADDLVHWKGFGDSIKSIFQDLAAGLIRVLEQVLFNPLEKLLGNAITSLLGFSSAGAGGAGGLFGVGGLFGALGLGGALLPGTLTGLGAATGYGAISAGTLSAAGADLAASLGIAGGTGGAGAGLAGLLGLGGGAGLLGLGSLTIPVIGAAIAGLSVALPKLISAIQGPNSWQAGSPEAMRDFGINLSASQFQQFAGGLGLSEAQTWNIRKDLESSPLFLTQIAAPLAQAQGTMSQFLKDLETVKTSWGTFNFRTAFETGQATGDWSQLNQEFAEAFSRSGALVSIMPDFATKLAAVGSGATAAGSAVDAATQTIIDGFTAIESGANSLIVPVKTMYDQFLQTGTITDEFAAKITELGGDLSKFQDLSDLEATNKQFSDLVDHFNKTGEILPALRDIFQKFGGDLSVLDQAAALPGLHSSLDFITSLMGQLQGLATQFDPIQKMLSGTFDQSVIDALTGAGIDPSRLQALTGLIGEEKNWANAVQEFQKTGKLNSTIEVALQQFGGAAGQQALAQYAQGFNTITSALLASTKTAMDVAYQRQITDALSYLGTLQQSTNQEITNLTQAVDDQLTLVGDNLKTAISDAAQAVVDQIKLMMQALTGMTSTGQPSTPGTPTGVSPGPSPEPPPGTGPGEGEGPGGPPGATFVPGRTQPMSIPNLPAVPQAGATVINLVFNNPIILGARGVAELTHQGLIELKRRGISAVNPGY